MKTHLKITSWLLWSCCAATATLFGAPAQALTQSVQAPAAAPSTPKQTAPEQPIPALPVAPPIPDDADAGEWSRPRHHQHHRVDNDNSQVNIGHDVFLAENEKADDVVAILGSATSAGIVANSVVSIAGSTRVTGPVGDSAVAVLGSVYVDSAIAGDVVAVLGNIELGPNANVAGDLVAVGGTVKRDPASKVSGESRGVAIGGNWGGLSALDPWLKHCFYLGRPLAFVPGIGWAWTLALVALALYAFVALLFGGVVDQCVKTLEQHPGASLITSVLAMIGTPILFVVLVVTVVGILAIPFLGIAVLLTQFFGKLVMLTWIGRRIMKATPAGAGSHAVAATLIGGAIVLLLYTVPLLGALLYHLLGLIGFGVVLYTMLLQMRARRPVRAEAAAAADATAATAGAARVGAPAAATPAATASEPAAAVSEQASAENLSSEQPQPSSAQAASPGAAPPAVPPAGARAKRVPAASAISLPRAGFWIRMVALLFDAVLVGVVLHLLRDSSRLFLVFLAAYGAIMWKLRGSTVGGIIFNLQVVQQDGREMEWSTALVRALSSFLSLIAIGLGFIWIAVDSDNRAWHDKIAGTIVVRVP